MLQPSLSRTAMAVIALLVTAMPSQVAAVPASPRPHTLVQPDGEAFTARQWGDENLHGWETRTGRTIVKDPLTRQWTYAVPGWDGALVSSGVRVATGADRDAVEQGFELHLRPQVYSPTGAFAAPRKQSTAEKAPFLAPALGAANIPVILVNFSNTTTTHTASQFNTLLFGTGNNSMSDYYKEVSYGKFTVAAGPSGVAGWYKASDTHDYYGANDAFGSDQWSGDLIQEAVAAADAAGYNFAPYDKDGDCYVDVVNIVHQGLGEDGDGGATDIWSHRWSLNDAKANGYSHSGEYTTQSDCPAGGKIKVNDYLIQPERMADGIQTMGVFAHEYGHALGLPDLYDTDNSSEGVGEWSLMASGNWIQVTRAGDRPSHMDPWSKYKLGWIAPTLVSGTLTKEPIAAANTTSDVYQIRGGSPSAGGEYFLVENRQKAGFDAGLPGSGLLIWHVDEAKSTGDLNQDNAFECYPGGPACASQHYHVALVQADNLWNLEKSVDRGDAGDSYPGTAGKTAFNAASAPNSNLYSGSASNVSVTAISASSAIMTATLSSTNGAANKPDFVVTGVTVSPATPAVNGTFRVSVTVENQGTLSGNGGILAVWANQSTAQACGATGDASVTVGTLAAGASATFAVTGLPAGAAGAKSLRVFVDKNCAAGESNESNNQYAKAYTVGGGAPDLVVTKVALNPAFPAPNGTFSATVTVKNQGTAASSGDWLDVWANQATPQSCGADGDNYVSIGSLAAGASANFTVAGLPAGAAGAKTLRAFVDSYCQTAESSESNNQYTKTYTVADKPDFAVAGVTLSPATPAANGTFSASVTVKNQGTLSGDGGTLTIWANQSTVLACGATGDASVTVGTLTAGTSVTFTVAGLPAGAAGTRTLRAFVDKNCATGEAREGNNQYAKAYSTQ